jgi:hypothetical protein
MKRVWGVALMAVVWAGTGCVHLPTLWDADKPEPPVPAAPPPKPAAPVTAEDVTEANAHQKAKALLEEMDRAAVDRE